MNISQLEQMFLFSNKSSKNHSLNITNATLRQIAKPSTFYIIIILTGFNNPLL